MVIHFVHRVQCVRCIHFACQVFGASSRLWAILSVLAIQYLLCCYIHEDIGVSAVLFLGYQPEFLKKNIMVGWVALVGVFLHCGAMPTRGAT